MSEEEWLVCASADNPRVIPGSDFSKVCSKCGTRVMIAPSGQRCLREHPKLKIVCGSCALKEAMQSKNSPDTDVRLTGTVKEIESEVDSTIPNTYRHRN